MTREDIAKGLALLSTAFGRTLTDQLVEVYAGVVGPKLDAGQWERAVRRALEAESFFPPPAVLLRYGLTEGLPEARAVEFYDVIVGHYECGDNLSPREISERYGNAAMEAFCAAGGHRAFAWCEPRDEPFRRKAFVEGWVETAEQNPALALSPAQHAPALLEPQTEPGPSRAEAAAILAGIVERAGRR